ncbi:calcium activated cation channel [Sparassis crispa]|uniref:Calcium activated cation channel n=1 Tax=Sparassis crispa TaxID=139825 RepID=A0A401GCS3_9APHY|nr:calcium activated cation channel [Sparassis crispa]GBE79923.1 calcium activated cation channel [Sparassis crispa]
MMRDDEHNGEDLSTLSPYSTPPSPDTLTSLIRRLRVLTLKLLPVEVPVESINDPTSRVITLQVISAYIGAAGDFLDALPYCLLRAHKDFRWDANHNPADYEENTCRATACEVLARRVVHQAGPDRISHMLSTRFRHSEPDGDMSENASALELAIDSHCIIFLSSSEAQAVVDDIWRGELIQKRDKDGETKFVPYKHSFSSFWEHLDPSRMGVPRYLNMFRIIVWFLFLIAYSQAVREPLDKLNPDHSDFEAWEIIMYILGLSFSFEDLHKIYQLLLFVSWRALGFWHVVSFLTDSLLLAAFILRVWGIAAADPQSVMLRTRSFQCLSFVAPLIWMKLIPIFDGFKFVGTMQICVARMLKESGIFFGLLALLGIGFLQGLYALDAADGQADHPYEVMHVLVQSLLQSPDYQKFSASPSGQLLYYLWNVATTLILLNVLISLFSSAYDDVIEDAAAQYLTYFAGKVVGMLRAPDDYAYPAPFNLIETFLIAPFEFFVSTKAYSKINRYVMLVLFVVPLSMIVVYESELDPAKNKWVKDWLSYPDEDSEDDPQVQNPEVAVVDAERGLRISKVPFEALVKEFPDTTHSSEAVILREVRDLKEQIEELKKLLAQKA